MLKLIVCILEIIDILMILYGIYYVIIGIFVFLKEKKIKKTNAKNRFAIIIPARNEEKVIGNLLDSLEKQKYPKELYDVFVFPNNCNDKTREIAIENNAKIIECSKKIKSKGEALKYSFKYLNDNFNCYDAFIIFDADNVVHPQFIEKMNDALCSGYQLAQGYRDSKNPHDTWISNCYTLYYMIQNHFFNRARMNIGQSSFINGTGFMIAKERLYKKGYNPKSMTEDIELSVKCAINNEEIAFVREAITYDEQITTLKESFKQRMRWSIGTNQCLLNYAPNLIQEGIKGKLNCIDALIFLMAPTLQIVSSIAFALHIILAIIYGISNDILSSILSCYLTSIALSIFAIKSNNKRIKDNLKGILTFPIFILTWIPVNIIALWKRNYKWERIEHNKGITIEKILECNNQEIKSA